ncbi:MAG: HupE/UreJ family protein [Gammaproteobacteria bacterium]|nr:HupE/UreJ family protein [Gammaproteobacteria bacterium]
MITACGSTGVSRVPLAPRGSRTPWVVIVAAAGSLLCDRAAAHMGTGLPGGFVSGFVHPFSGVDHLLAMVSVGLWGAFLGRPLIFALPVVFPAMMVGGALMGMFVVPLPPVELGIALSVLVLGGCIALSVRAPIWAASLVVALFAVFHGYAHGKELPSAADPVSYSAGFVLATGLLHVSGIAVGFVKDRPGGLVATRSIGAAIATIGAWFLYRAIGT